MSCLSFSTKGNRELGSHHPFHSQVSWKSGSKGRNAKQPEPLETFNRGREDPVGVGSMTSDVLRDKPHKELILQKSSLAFRKL